MTTTLWKWMARRAFIVGLLFFAAIGARGPAQAACLQPEKSTGGPRAMSVEDGRGKKVQLYSRSIALLVGESNYLGPPKGLALLPSVPTEILGIRLALEAQGFEVWTYLDLPKDKLYATLECIIREELPADSDMRFLFWFTGHGTTVHRPPKVEGYVLPVDMPPLTGDEAGVRAVTQNGVRLAAFVDWARSAIRARHALFIFDSCFSGTVLDSAYRPIGPRDEKPQPAGFATTAEARMPLREFLAAGSESQTLPASSIFAEEFIQVMTGQKREADANNDGMLTGTELTRHLKSIVSERSYQQTPMSGRLRERALNRGEIVFVPPAPEAPMSPPGASGGKPAAMRPVFRGAIAQASAGPNIVQQYEADAYLKTVTTACSAGCNLTGQSRIEHLVLTMPPDAPPASVFDTPELICLSGPCKSGAEVRGGPSLSLDRRSAYVALAAWGESSTWRLAARVLTPQTGEGAIVVDRHTGVVKEVAQISVAVEGGAPLLAAHLQETLRTVLEELQVDHTATRRSARVKLARLIEKGPPQLVTQLVRQLHVGTYRYKLGVATALAQVADGWSGSEAASRTVLKKLQSRVAEPGKPATPGQLNDPALWGALSRALRNQRFYAYYERGADGWMTVAGQLRKVDENRPPMSHFDSLVPGDVLRADSAVNLRAGVGVASGLVSVAPAGQCLIVVKPERSYAEAGSEEGTGGWLQVRLRASCPSPTQRR